MAAKTPVVILKDYFGYRAGQGLSDFIKELKALTDADKRELVELAAKELKVEVAWEQK